LHIQTGQHNQCQRYLRTVLVCKWFFRTS